jgi:hypothetical protein
MEGDRFKELDLDLIIKISKASKKVREKVMEEFNITHRTLLGQKSVIFAQLIKDNKIEVDEIKEFQDDTYVEYLNMVAYAKPSSPDDKLIMVTCSKELLANRDKLFKKFGVEVCTIQEVMQKTMDEAKNEKSMGNKRS